MIYIPLKSYLLHQLRSTKKRKIHSPFVFQFYEQVLMDSALSKSALIEKRKKKLIADKQLINITDLGAGSNHHKSNERSIQYIAKTSSKTAKTSRLLFRLTQFTNAQNILELGTSFGISTSYLSLAQPNAHINTIEGCPNIAHIAAETFKKTNATNVKQHIGNLDDILGNTIKDSKTLDLVLFDGNHRKDANLNYFKICLPKINRKTVFVFDDIRWSKEMLQLWEELILHQAVSLSIDLFDMGLLFFHESHQKEHFRLRY